MGLNVREDSNDQSIPPTAATLPSSPLPVITKDLPISPRFSPTTFLSRAKFSTLPSRQQKGRFLSHAYSRNRQSATEATTKILNLPGIELAASAPTLVLINRHLPGYPLLPLHSGDEHLPRPNVNAYYSRRFESSCADSGFMCTYQVLHCSTDG